MRISILLAILETNARDNELKSIRPETGSKTRDVQQRRAACSSASHARRDREGRIGRVGRFSAALPPPPLACGTNVRGSRMHAAGTLQATYWRAARAATCAPRVANRGPRVHTPAQRKCRNSY